MSKSQPALPRDKRVVRALRGVLLAGIPEEDGIKRSGASWFSNVTRDLAVPFLYNAGYPFAFYSAAVRGERF